MPNVKASDIAKLAGYEREVGIDNKAPEGRHNVKVERAEVRKDESGVPTIFTLLRIRGGDYDNKTIPNSLRWFAAETDRDGSPKDAGKLKSDNGFVRQQTLGFIKAVLGKDVTKWPDDVILPGGDSTAEEVADAFATIAEAVLGRDAGVEVTPQTRKNKQTGQREETDYQNFKFYEASEEAAFKL